MPRSVNQIPASVQPAVQVSDESAGRTFLNQFLPTRSPANLAFDNLLDRRILRTSSLDRALLVLGNFFGVDDSAEGLASAWELKGNGGFQANLDLSLHPWISNREISSFCKVGGIELPNSTLVAFSVAPPLLQTRGIIVLPKNGGAVGAAVDNQGDLMLPRESFLIDRQGYCHAFSLSHSVPPRFSGAFASLRKIHEQFVQTMGC